MPIHKPQRILGDILLLFNSKHDFITLQKFTSNHHVTREVQIVLHSLTTSPYFHDTSAKGTWASTSEAYIRTSCELLNPLRTKKTEHYLLFCLR